MAALSASVLDAEPGEYRDDAAAIRGGRELFKLYCAACHDLGNDGIGPALAAVTLEREKDWLLRFIQDPKAVVDSGDPLAQELVRKYKVVMPTFGLSNDDVEQVLAYLYAKRKPVERRVVGVGGVSDPVPEKIQLAGVGLDLGLAWRIPSSNDKPPAARINKMAGVRTGEGDRLFVNDQRGYLYELAGEGPQLVLNLNTIFPDFVSAPGLATGFSSFAFSPEFESSGLFYTQHAERGGAGPADFALPEGDTAKLQYVINEWRLDTSKGGMVQGTPREVLRIDVIDTSHGMQELAFNPYVREGDEDYGLLYVGIGDGGASYIRRTDLMADGSTVWGKVLRIDPRGRNSGNGKYGIPRTNPFVGGSRDSNGVLPEIYALGFRNPNTLAWSEGGLFLVADIGHWNVEELNLVQAGRDYGWPRYEGAYKIDLKTSQEHVFERESPDSGVVDPLIQIDHDELRAIAGGFVYYGDRLPLLKGHYLFGGIATGRVFAVELSDSERVEARELQLFNEETETSLAELVQVGRADLRMGSDASGEPYLLSKSDGSIWKIVGARKLEQ